MKNLFNKNIRCTDPATLQFCLPVSGDKFWYCEPNGFHDSLLPDSSTQERQIYERFIEYPYELLKAAERDAKVKPFLQNKLLWLSGTIDVRDFSDEEKRELAVDYGMTLDGMAAEEERNQLICEFYFESTPMDFRNDI
ncbi:MAG: hypothetical protein EZS26_001002 [Candidatus Ordinivivax streblomastigis]|uniref:Uncharacterized protein n=1 Tax=Candidatus Ordinivivax streblomastigis TaxID=2540710 RepID=A0A5M8P3B4_9BACT|nr:MAG: hypothetical protein EZS26_001002 [Candidatus Ordinivivax streblomastigis]